jgi:hypothetical protein
VNSLKEEDYLPVNTDQGIRKQDSKFMQNLTTVACPPPSVSLQRMIYGEHKMCAQMIFFRNLFGVVNTSTSYAVSSFYMGPELCVSSF